MVHGNKQGVHVQLLIRSLPLDALTDPFTALTVLPGMVEFRSDSAAPLQKLPWQNFDWSSEHCT